MTRLSACCGHAEKRKPGNKADWNNDDWGNYIAHRAAAADYDTLRALGLNLQILEVSAKDLYQDLIPQAQWYIGHPDGTPLEPRGLLAHMNEQRFQNYLTDRDKDRATRQDPTFWTDNYLQYSARTFQTTTAPPACWQRNVE